MSQDIKQSAISPNEENVCHTEIYALWSNISFTFLIFLIYL